MGELEEGEIVEGEVVEGEEGASRDDEMGEENVLQNVEGGGQPGENVWDDFGGVANGVEVRMVVANEDGERVVVGAGGMFNIDWDHFLRNPGAYAVEGEEDAGVQGGGFGIEIRESLEEMDEDDGMDEAGESEDEEMGQDGDDMEEDGAEGEIGAEGEMEADNDMDEDEDEGDEDEDENINALMGGLQVGGQDAQQQAIQQMTQAEPNDDLDLALYIADEDVGEDGRTRKLRDWFRPW